MPRLLLALMAALLLSACSDEPTAAAPTQNTYLSAQPLFVYEHTACAKENVNCSSVNIMALNTSLPWVNKLLLEKTLQVLSDESSVDASLEAARQQAQALQEKEYAGIQEALKQFDSASLAFELTSDMALQGTSQQLILISHSIASYTGGAHGNYAKHYYVLDMAQERQLTLDDVLHTGAREALAQQLVNKAKADPKTFFYTDESEPTAELYDEVLFDNFYFTNEGLVLSYPPYAIGPFASGQIDIAIAYEELAGILKQDYFP